MCRSANVGRSLPITTAMGCVHNEYSHHLRPGGPCVADYCGRSAMCGSDAAPSVETTRRFPRSSPAARCSSCSRLTWATPGPSVWLSWAELPNGLKHPVRRTTGGWDGPSHPTSGCLRGEPESCKPPGHPGDVAMQVLQAWRTPTGVTRPPAGRTSRSAAGQAHQLAPYCGVTGGGCGISRCSATNTTTTCTTSNAG